MRPILFAYDTETNIVDHVAGAWRDGTYVVLSGMMADGQETPTLCPGNGAWRLIYDATQRGPVIVAGQNLTFDLCHTMKEAGALGLRWLLSPRVSLWDTQVVDYLLSGCSRSMPSLEESGAQFGVHIKKDEWASSAFEKGIGADILYAENPQRLRDYLASDVVGTLRLARAQAAYLRDKVPGMRQVVRTQMRVIKLVVLCQHLGLPINRDVLARLTAANLAELAANESTLKAALDALMPNDIARAYFKASSPAQLAALLYGGTIEYDERVPVGVYKTGAKVGQPRYKIVTHAVTFPPHVSERADSKNPDNTRPTGESTLESIAVEEDTPDRVRALVRPMLKHRELSKLDSTYYQTIAEKIKQSVDGRLHGDLNQAVTNTGRKSSSGPNLQNIPDAVREAIEAEQGYTILCVDAKQLEVIGLALLSGDPALRKALKRGDDIHGIVQARAVARVGHDIARTDVKRVVFGRFYGGGAATLSAQSGIPITVVRTILEELDAAFPVAANFYKKVRAVLIRRAYVDASGQRVSTYPLPSGRLLHFVVGEDGQFKYTEMKNRAVQSYATGDIVPYIEQAYIEWLQKDPSRIISGRIRPLVSVHDELVQEVRNDALDEAKAFFVELQANIVPMLNAWYGIDPPIDLPLVFSLGTGRSWLEAKKKAVALA